MPPGPSMQRGHISGKASRKLQRLRRVGVFWSWIVGCCKLHPALHKRMGKPCDPFAHALQFRQLGNIASDGASILVMWNWLPLIPDRHGEYGLLASRGVSRDFQATTRLDQQNIISLPSFPYDNLIIDDMFPYFSHVSCMFPPRLALDSTGWNPDQAFNLAEGHALSLIQVSCLFVAENRMFLYNFFTD